MQPNPQKNNFCTRDYREIYWQELENKRLDPSYLAFAVRHNISDGQARGAVAGVWQQKFREIQETLAKLPSNATQNIDTSDFKSVVRVLEYQGLIKPQYASKLMRLNYATTDARHNVLDRQAWDSLLSEKEYLNFEEVLNLVCNEGNVKPVPLTSKSIRIIVRGVLLNEQAEDLLFVRELATRYQIDLTLEQGIKRLERAIYAVSLQMHGELNKALWSKSGFKCNNFFDTINEACNASIITRERAHLYRILNKAYNQVKHWPILSVTNNSTTSIVSSSSSSSSLPFHNLSTTTLPPLSSTTTSPTPQTNIPSGSSSTSTRSISPSITTQTSTPQTTATEKLIHDLQNLSLRIPTPSLSSSVTTTGSSSSTSLSPGRLFSVSPRSSSTNSSTSSVSATLQARKAN